MDIRLLEPREARETAAEGCVVRGNPAILACFPAHKTALTTAHRAELDRIARAIATAGRDGRPIGRVRIDGYAAEWKRITSAAAYQERSQVRAQAAADYLRSELRRLEVARMPRFVLRAMGLANRRAPDMPAWSTAQAQRNRALNRRVEVFLFPAKPTPPKPTPKPPPPKPKPGRRTIRVPVCYRGDVTPDLKTLVYSSAVACNRARKRIARLARMSPAERRKAWDAGPEKDWFGAYAMGGRADFRFVARRIESMWSIVAGNATPGRSPCRDRRNVLTVEGFRCDGRPKRTECRKLRGTRPPQRRWLAAPPSRRLQTEDPKLDKLYACCNMRGDAGWSYVDLRGHDDFSQPPEPRPHKIHIGPAWFRKPRGMTAKAWLAQRRLTVMHEIAHLAGVRQIRWDPALEEWVDSERYGARVAKRLSRRKPETARINAENYALYVMSFEK